MMPSVSGNVFAEGQIDRGFGVLYDRQTTAVSTATPNAYYFFSTPISGTKTKTDTNLTQGNRLPPPEAFHVQSVGFHTGPKMLLIDLVALMINYYFEFRIGQKPFLEGPLFLFPSGAGINGFATTTVTANTGMLQTTSNGEPSALARRTFGDYPRTIPPNASFGVNVLGTSFTTIAAVAAIAGIGSPAYGGVDLMAILEGLWDRPVQ